MTGDAKVNGSMKIWIAVLGIVTGIVTGGLGAGMINTGKYDDLETKFEAFISNEMQEEIREEHRLTKIEEAIINTNKLLEEIRNELRDRKD